MKHNEPFEDDGRTVADIIPLPIGQQMIPQMVCQLGLFRGKIGIRSGFLRNTLQEHEQFQRL